MEWKKKNWDSKMSVIKSLLGYIQYSKSSTYTDSSYADS
jgi:hypothetical protein